MAKMLSVLLSVLFVFGCNRDGNSQEWRRNIYGYSVRYVVTPEATNDTVSSGTALYEIDRWHADAVNLAAISISSNYSIPMLDVYKKAKAVNWIFVDNCTFVSVLTDSGSYVNGETDGNTVAVGIYAREEGLYSDVPPDAPEWTVLTIAIGTVRSRWGSLNPPFQDVEHQILHLLFGETYPGHTVHERYLF